MPKKNPLSDKARKLYEQGMKLVDIADKLDVPPGTIRRWKSTQNWDKKSQESKPERSGKKSERSPNKKERLTAAAEDGTKETMQNVELSTEEQLFCVYYNRTYNATQSYLKAYKTSYDTANAEGYKLLVRPCIQKELARLKEIKRQMIAMTEEDIVELQMRIAFADVGDYQKWEDGLVSAISSEMVDTQLVKRVGQGKYGLELELKDSQKAMDWLTKYFTIHPQDKYRLEFEKQKASVKENTTEQVLKNMKSIEELLQNPVQNRDINDLESQEE